MSFSEVGLMKCAYSEQEHERTMESSNVGDRTQHEIYAHPFLRSVMAGVASVMCSYSAYPLFNSRLALTVPLQTKSTRRTRARTIG